MAKRAISAIRALFRDAQRVFEEESQALPDPLPEAERNGVKPGQWPGAPVQKLPDACPVIPLGKADKVSFFIDTLGQLAAVAAGEWGNKQVFDLFALTPNYPLWAWPRWSEPKQGKAPRIIGIKGDDAQRALVNACARRGLFDPADRVRGRGGWADAHNRFIWHSGDALWTVEGGRLRVSKPGELDDVFYPRRPAIVRPWEEAVEPADSPAHQILKDLGTWTFERAMLDPFLILGWMGCALLGGALAWRPSIFIVGDRGVGKSTLQGVVKTILDDALHATADTTAAGIYQRVNQDSLAVAVDELEADATNLKTRGVLSLARLASSGALMFRGGQNHAGTEFRARNAFMFSAINPPPMTTAEKSRIGMVALGRIDQARVAGTQPVAKDIFGRMILRQLMDGWGELQPLLEDWKRTLWQAGFDGRAQETYGTLLAVSQLLAGAEAFEDAGLPVTDEPRLGALIRTATAAERAEQRDNWRDCLGHILSSPIDAWKGGEKPSVGGTLEDLREGRESLDFRLARERLQLVGLNIREKERGKGAAGYWLMVPPKGVPLARLFQGSIWAEGVWFGALKQAPASVVDKSLGNHSVIKINGDAHRCLMIDLDAYDAHVSKEDDDGPPPDQP